jgi:phospholipase/carboxylesterase
VFARPVGEEPRMPRAALLLTVVLVAAACNDQRHPAMPSPDFVARVAEPRQAGAGRPPLLVLLHGVGADENDLLPLAPLLDPRLEVVSLRAPRDYPVGYAWFQIDFGTDGSVRPHTDQAEQSLADLVRWLEDAPERYGTDPERTYLLGFSQGAMMSLGVLRTAPELLAGVMALSGRDPETLFPMTASRDAVGAVPLLVAHGTLDDLLPVENGRRTRAAFEGLSADFTYREFPVGHGIDQEEIMWVRDWLRARLDS